MKLLPLVVVVVVVVLFHIYDQAQNIACIIYLFFFKKRHMIRPTLNVAHPVSETAIIVLRKITLATETFPRALWI